MHYYFNQAHKLDGFYRDKDTYWNIGGQSCVPKVHIPYPRHAPPPANIEYYSSLEMAKIPILTIFFSWTKMTQSMEHLPVTKVQENFPTTDIFGGSMGYNVLQKKKMGHKNWDVRFFKH